MKRKSVIVNLFAYFYLLLQNNNNLIISPNIVHAFGNHATKACIKCSKILSRKRNKQDYQVVPNSTYSYECRKICIFWRSETSTKKSTIPPWYLNPPKTPLFLLLVMATHSSYGSPVDDSGQTQIAWWLIAVHRAL